MSVPSPRDGAALPRGGARAIGIVLVLPAVAVGVWQILLPAWQTIRFSLFTVPGFARGPSRFLGLEAYGGPWADWLVGFSSLIGVAAFVVVSLIGVLIGALTARAEAATRRAVRAVLGVAMIVYAPLGVGLAVRTDLRGLSDGPLLFWVLCVVLLPITAALTAVGIASALREDGTTAPRDRVLAAEVMFGVGLVTALALSLQMLPLPGVVIGNGADTLGQAIYRSALQFLDISRASAISTALLIVLAGLGLLVTVALLMLRLRVELAWDESARTTASRQRSGGIALAIALLTLVVFLIVARDWVLGLAASAPDDLSEADVAAIATNTWLPPAVTTVAQVLVAGLAGLGLGAFRPIGGHSEALLLLFAPGLFVGLTPLLTAKFLNASDGVRLADISLVPPMLLSVPALFVFTFVFAGLRRAWVRDPAARVRVLLTGLSTVLLVGVLGWVVQAQTVTWNLVVAADSHRVSGPVLLSRLAASDPNAPLPQQLATPLPLLVLLAVLAAFATASLDRLVVRAGPLRDKLSRG